MPQRPLTRAKPFFFEVDDSEECRFWHSSFLAWLISHGRWHLAVLQKQLSFSCFHALPNYLCWVDAWHWLSQPVSPSSLPCGTGGLPCPAPPLFLLWLSSHLENTTGYRQNLVPSGQRRRHCLLILPRNAAFLGKEGCSGNKGANQSTGLFQIHLSPPGLEVSLFGCMFWTGFLSISIDPTTVCIHIWERNFSCFLLLYMWCCSSKQGREASTIRWTRCLRAVSTYHEEHSVAAISDW